MGAKVGDKYLGNLWGGGVNCLGDGERSEGLGKGYYEGGVSIVEEKGDCIKWVLVECNRYLGYYYFVKEDYKEWKVYWNKILEIDGGKESGSKGVEGIK